MDFFRAPGHLDWWKRYGLSLLRDAGGCENLSGRSPPALLAERGNCFAFGFVRIHAIRVKPLRPLSSIVPHCGTKDDWRLPSPRCFDATSGGSNCLVKELVRILNKQRTKPLIFAYPC